MENKTYSSPILYNPSENAGFATNAENPVTAASLSETDQFLTKGTFSKMANTSYGFYLVET